MTNCDGYIKKSKHNYLPSRAVDIAIFVNGKLTWEENYYKAVAAHIMLKAYELNVKVTWVLLDRKRTEPPKEMQACS